MIFGLVREILGISVLIDIKRKTGTVKERKEERTKPKKDKNEDKDKQIANGYICVDVD